MSRQAVDNREQIHKYSKECKQTEGSRHQTADRHQIDKQPTYVLQIDERHTADNQENSAARRHGVDQVAHTKQLADMYQIGYRQKADNRQKTAG